MRVKDQLAFFARLHGADKGAAAERALYLLKRLDLDERADDIFETLSLGNQQRVQIAAALMHESIALVILAGGKLVAAGPVQRLRAGKHPRYRFEFPDSSTAESMRSIAGCEQVVVEGNKAWLTFSRTPSDD